MDRIFNSADLVQVFVRGEYEDDVAGNSVWSDGDWNGDGDFNSQDLVSAFAAGPYSRASVPTVPTVPAVPTVPMAYGILSVDRFQPDRTPSIPDESAPDEEVPTHRADRTAAQPIELAARDLLFDVLGRKDEDARGARHRPTGDVDPAPFSANDLGD